MSCHPTRGRSAYLTLRRVKIVSATDRSKILPVGERGELVVAGYLLQKGYWNDPVRTAEVMVEDEEGKMWMHVGFPSCSCEGWGIVELG